MTDVSALTALEAHESFLARHIGPSKPDIVAMLGVVGASSLDALSARTVPSGILTEAPMALPEASDEAAVLAELAELAARNDAATKSLIGCGYHNTHTPPVILRNVLENPGWYTAYTPYQAEIAQGRLEATETRQNQMMGFLSTALQNPSMLHQLVSSRQGIQRLENGSRTRAP